MANPARATPKPAPAAPALVAVPSVTTRSRREVASLPNGPRYRLRSPTLVDNRLWPVKDTSGRPTEVVYYGLPGSSMIPVNDEARARKAQVKSIRVDEALTPKAKRKALHDLSDVWNGVKNDDDDLDAEEAELDDEQEETEDDGEGKPDPED